MDSSRSESALSRHREARVWVAASDSSHWYVHPTSQLPVGSGLGLTEYLTAQLCRQEPASRVGQRVRAHLPTPSDALCPLVSASLPDLLAQDLSSHQAQSRLPTTNHLI